jgi:methyl halide transferase
VSEPTQAVDWEARFREGNTRWERGALHPAFLAWRAGGDLEPCRILVPGAGRSPEPLALAEAGFAVTVVDIAPSAIAFQRERLAPHGGTVISSDLLKWSAGTPFDAVYDQTCLCALPPPVLPAYAARLSTWLRPGGRLFALFMQTGREGGPPFDCPPEAMRALLPGAIWAWPARLGDPVAHAAGEEIPAILRRLA